MMRFRTGSATWLLLAWMPAAALAQAAPPALPPSAPPAPATATAMPAATTLPPVSIPATAAPALAPTTNALPVAPSSTPLADMVPPGATTPEEPKTSLGLSRTSIFFSPVQMQAVEEVLKDYESNVSTSTAPKTDLSVDLSQLQADTPEKKIVEPATYPVFYLSSIAYRSPGDWSIWVSGHKITSHKNTTNLQVVSVTPSQASFAWKPSYADSINTRKTANMMAPVEPVKNRLTSTPNFNHDPATGIITFTLRPNQSFAAAYLNTFEGFIESPKLPVMTSGADTAPVQAANGQPPVPPQRSTPEMMPSTDARQSPSETINSMSMSASRREIDAQLQRAEAAEQAKPQQ